MKDDFTRISMEMHKLAAFIKAPMEFIYDAQFDIKDYLVKRMGKTFASI